MQNKRSIQIQEKAKRLIPGMTQLFSKRPDQFAPGVWPGYFQKAKGVEVWDLDGNRFIDMSIAGIGACVLGYADPDVDQAVKEAISNGISCSLNCPDEVQLAELLCEIHPWAQSVRFARTGGESMAIAVRIARAHTDRDIIAFCGYHGWHDWYLAANLSQPDALGDHLMASLDPCGVPKGLQGTSLPFRYNYIEDLEKIVSENKSRLAAIVIEPIRSIYPESGFLESVRKIADQEGCVLIFDEISAGFRMNSGGSHLLFRVSPDVAVFSKALGNGYSIGAIIGKREVISAAEKTFISSTNWTERVGPAAAIATIKKHRTLGVGNHLMEIGRKIQEGWASVAKTHGLKIHVGGIPPLSHFVFESKQHLIMKTLFVEKMLERGFLASTLFYAMFAHQMGHVEQYLKAVDEVFGEIHEAQARNNLESQLKGSPAVVGFRKLR